MNVINFAILSGLGQCFGYPRRADFIPTTDKMQHLIYTISDVIYVILCFITYSDSNKYLFDIKRTLWNYNIEILGKGQD